MNQSHEIDIAAALLRAGLGLMFIAHALLKIVVFTIPGTVQFFESVGLPGVFAYATIAAELIGGTMLILGIRTRITAFALVPVLLGATWHDAIVILRLPLTLTKRRGSFHAVIAGRETR